MNIYIYTLRYTVLHSNSSFHGNIPTHAYSVKQGPLVHRGVVVKAFVLTSCVYGLGVVDTAHTNISSGWVRPPRPFVVRVNAYPHIVNSRGDYDFVLGQGSSQLLQSR